MGKAYWSKSMVVARLTGVPYRQNDMVLDAVNGRVLIRSMSVDGLEIDDDKFVQLQCTVDGRLLLRVMDDPKHLLKQHPRYVNKASAKPRPAEKNDNENQNENGNQKGRQRNMVLYARQQVRQACMKYGVKELRCRVKSAVRVSDKEVVAELKRVDDMAEMYGWGSRAKK